MGSVSKLKSGKYRARYRDPDGIQRARHFAKKVDAETWLTSIESAKIEGTYVSPAAGRQSFGAYANEWASRQIHRPSTKVLVRGHMKNHILPTFEKRALASIRPSEVQTWVKMLSEKLAPATVDVVYRYLASVLLSAVDDRILARTPCRGIKLPKNERPLVNPLPTESVIALTEAVPDRYHALVLCAAGAGLRQGEAFGLTVEHLDLLHKQLRVEQQLVQILGDPEFGPPKTKASRRQIPLPDVVVDALASHLATYGSGPSGLVFTDEQGRPLRRSRFSAKVWRPAVATTGVPEGTVFHGLRHYYASLLIHAGESVKTVQARLGHASAMETLDTYGHLWPNSEDRTRTVVQEAFRDPELRQVEDDLRTPTIA
jgi:integrase